MTPKEALTFEVFYQRDDMSRESLQIRPVYSPSESTDYMSLDLLVDWELTYA